MTRCVVVFGVLLGTLLPTTAHAVTCNVAGLMWAQPMDTYYCDPDVSGINCTGWKEQDLWDPGGTQTRPLPGQVMTFYDQGFFPLAVAVTDETWGGYDVNLNLPGTSCVGQVVYAAAFFLRAVPPSYGEYHFALVDQNDDVEGFWGPITLTGPSTIATWTHAAGPNPDWVQRAATVYWTANSAITEMKTWSSRVNDHLTGPL